MHHFHINMNMFVLLLLLGSFLLFISVMNANSTMQRCTEETKLCPDGTVLSRDPFNNCTFPSCPHSDLFPYCTKNVVKVEQSGDNIRTISSLLGGGFTVYSPSNVTHCPVVSPQAMSIQCRKFLSLNWSVSINCSLVNSSLAYKCPSDYNELQGYKWINCSNRPEYCTPRLKQWIAYNCGIDFVS